MGLGAIGALAAKPVMEGKAVLFKEFAGIDVFDIEVDERDPDKLIEVIAALEPTFGGINLEDIKAPECFYAERELTTNMAPRSSSPLACSTDSRSWARASNRLSWWSAARACVDLLVDLGLPMHNIWLTDLAGTVWKGRTELMDPDKARASPRRPPRGRWRR